MVVGVFYAYFPYGAEPVNWPEILKRVKAAGASHVELSSMRLMKQDKAMRKATVETAKELGLSYTFCTSLPAGGDVSSDDPLERQRGIDAVRANIDTVAEMGGHVIGGMLHGSTIKAGVPVDNETRQRRMENSAGAVKEMAGHAAACGVRLGLEMCNRYENSMLNTVSQGLDFLKMVDHPAVGLHLDTYHMNIEEDDIAGAIMLAGKNIVNVHACDNNRKLPGMGHINWREVLMALKAVDYQGYLAMECFSRPFGCWTNDHRLWREYTRSGVDEDLIACIQYLKEIQHDLNLI